MNENRKGRIAQLANMKSHLAEAAMLTGRRVDREELLSLDKTLAISDLARSKVYSRKREFEISFAELGGARFAKYIGELATKRNEPVYLWTKLTRDCGLLELASLISVKFDFPFKSRFGSQFDVTTTNLSEWITFDWYQENQLEIMKIVARGEEWPTVQYV